MLEMLDAQVQAARNRSRLVRNRWQLFWMLHKNPVLQGYRCHVLEVMFEKNIALKQEVDDAKEAPAWKRVKDAVVDDLNVIVRDMTRPRAAAPRSKLPPAASVELESRHSSGCMCAV